MKKAIHIILVLFGVISISCQKKSVPVQSSGIKMFSEQQIPNTYSLDGKNYSATIAGKGTYISPDSNFHILIVEDARGSGLQFWFPKNPIPGNYSVNQMGAGSSNGVWVYYNSSEESGHDYYSLTRGNVTVSTDNNGNINLSVENLIMQQFYSSNVVYLNATKLVIP
jgi:hypothetical protein